MTSQLPASSSAAARGIRCLPGQRAARRPRPPRRRSRSPGAAPRRRVTQDEAVDAARAAVDAGAAVPRRLDRGDQGRQGRGRQGLRPRRTSRSRSRRREQTVYQLASVTKPFTAMATLMLVEGGKLSLDGKVTDDPARAAGRLGAGHGAPPADPHVGHQELHRRVRREEGRRQPGVHPRRRSSRWSRTRRWQFTPGEQLRLLATPATTCSG